MKIERITSQDIIDGVQINMWMTGIIGAMLTTLPAFLYMPIWFLFVHNFKLVNKDGNPSYKGAFLTGLLFGISVWLIVILTIGLSNA